MSETKHFQATLDNLGELLRTVDLGQNLFNEAVLYFEILDSKESTTEQKHRACILVEDLISKTRDFPRLNFDNKVTKR